MAHLHEQLRAAWEARKAVAAQRKRRLTHEWLIKKAGLTCDRTSLSRKLSGEQIMTTEECELLARALGVEVTCGREARAS